MYHSTKDHIDNHNILSVFQHGFRAGHSCDSQLLSTVYDLIVHIWFEMSSRRSSAWFFQGLWCCPTSEAPWENQALRHQRYDPSLDQWLSEWKHTVSCCRWVLFELVYCSIRSATGHRTRSPPLLLYIYILTTCQIVSIAGSGFLPTTVWCTGKLAALKTSLHCREIWMPWKFGQVHAEWNLTQVNATFYQSQDSLPCIHFTPYVTRCFSM